MGPPPRVLHATWCGITPAGHAVGPPSGRPARALIRARPSGRRGLADAATVPPRAFLGTRHDGPRFLGAIRVIRPLLPDPVGEARSLRDHDDHGQFSHPWMPSVLRSASDRIGRLPLFRDSPTGGATGRIPRQGLAPPTHPCATLRWGLPLRGARLPKIPHRNRVPAPTAVSPP